MANSESIVREGSFATSEWPRILLGLVVFAAFMLCQAGFARAETRVLKFYHLHTHERATIAYKRNGQYIPSGLRQINHILRDWRENEEVKINPRLLDLLWQVYRVSGSHDYINVICGFRSPETNSMLRRRSNGVAKKSQHMLGNAIDFYLPDVPLSKLRKVALKMQDGGVGYYPTSGSPFVHLDVGSVRHWPRMSRSQLLALFPDGKTMHIPSDGKPLPGYNQALAAYKQRVSKGQILMAGDTGGGSGGGLLAALFGGGADDEEDSSGIDAVPSRQPAQQPSSTLVAGAPQAAAPTAPEPESPATILAALPARAIPVPRAAPRPDVDVGAAPVMAAAVEIPQPADDAAGQQAKLALRDIPIPTSRPDYTPPAPQKETLVAAADLPAAAGGQHADDAIAELLRSQEETGVAPDVAAYVPVPSARPPFTGDAASPMPEPRAVVMASAQDKFAEALALGNDGIAPAESRPVSDSPRLAMLSPDADTRPTGAFTTGVRTTAKGSRPGPQDLKPEPGSIIMPVRAETARWALSADAILGNVEGTRRPDFDATLVRAPEAVYTAGFRQAADTTNAQHFTGKAVKFLAVAWFSEE